MLIPRIGAVLLLIGYGFAIAQVGRLMYVVASEGYSSWVAVAVMLVIVGGVGLASAVLVLFRKPLGARLALPFCVLLGATAIITFFGLPPVGQFLDDYEAAALARGVTVPPYLADQGVTPEEYVEDEVGDVKVQGALGSVAVILVYVATVVRGSRSRPRKTAQAGAKA